MRIFNLKRIAYFEDLENDIDVQQMFEYRWVKAKDMGARSWEPEICKIKGIKWKDYMTIPILVKILEYQGLYLEVFKDHVKQIAPDNDQIAIYYNPGLDIGVFFDRVTWAMLRNEENLHKILDWIQANPSMEKMVDIGKLDLLK